MIRIICSGVGNIIQHLFSVQAISFRNREKTNGAESALRVDIQALSLSTTHVYRQLTCYGECVAQLRLSRPELPEEFSDSTGLNAT